MWRLLQKMHRGYDRFGSEDVLGRSCTFSSDISFCIKKGSGSHTVTTILISNLSLSLSSCFEFEVLTAVIMKSIIFWDVTPCSLVKVNRRSIGKYCLHRQVRRVNQA
jgi:hypothetical protein